MNENLKQELLKSMLDFEHKDKVIVRFQEDFAICDQSDCLRVEFETAACKLADYWRPIAFKYGMFVMKPKWYDGGLRIAFGCEHGRHIKIV